MDHAFNTATMVYGFIKNIVTTKLTMINHTLKMSFNNHINVTNNYKEIFFFKH